MPLISNQVTRSMRTHKHHEGGDGFSGLPSAKLAVLRDNSRMPVKRKPAKVAKQPKLPAFGQLLNGVISLVETGRTTAGRAVNQTITATYWLIGRQIIKHEQGGSHRAGYGKTLIARLSVELTKRFGRGFSVRNLEQMRRGGFYVQLNKRIT